MLAAMSADPCKTFRPRFAAVLLALLVTGAAGAADQDPLGEQRELFVLAHAAVEAGAPIPSAADPAALRDYPLYPYLERARFEQALGRAVTGWTQTDDDVRAFLAAHSGEA